MLTVKKFKKTEVMDLNEAYQKALVWFFSFPDREIGLSDLAEALNISKTTANRVITQLVDEHFLKLEIMGKLWRISCNKQHIYNFSRKIAYNLTLIYESGIISAIHEIIINPRAIILFGSYRKGDDIEKSDIDIAVEILGDDDIKIIELGVIPELGHRKDVKVNLHVFSRNKIGINLFSNIANGILLDGFLEVRP